MIIPYICHMDDSAIQLLGQISTLKTGYSFRGKIPEIQDGEIEVFQPRDILEGKLITNPVCIRLASLTGNYNHLLLKAGQLLLANKGLRFATYLVEPRPLPGLASASFFIVEVNTNVIMPEFLQWYLGQKEALNYLTAHAQKSTAISSINKQVIERLPIPLPSLIIQREVCDLVKDVQREARLLEDLKTSRKEFTDSYIWQSIIMLKS
jgi:hypothetical protein